MAVVQHIGRQGILRLEIERLRPDADDLERKVELASQQPIHPGGDATADIGIAAFDDEADVGHRLDSFPDDRNEGPSHRRSPSSSWRSERAWSRKPASSRSR